MQAALKLRPCEGTLLNRKIQPLTIEPRPLISACAAIVISDNAAISSEMFKMKEAPTIPWLCCLIIISSVDCDGALAQNIVYSWPFGVLRLSLQQAVLIEQVQWSKVHEN